MSSRRLSVLLFQLPVPNNPRANIPLAAGYLKAYAHKQGLLDHVDIDILPRSVVDAGGDALIVDEIIRRRPDILGISLYTWNGERSLHLAAQAKAALPEMLVVVGGPEVQRDNAWVLEHPAVDVAVLGEGEQTFVALLRAMLEDRAPYGAFEILRPCRLCAVDGIAHRHDGELRFTSPREGLADLAEVPSPYLLGYLPLEPGDMALAECSRWCPYRCSFCLYGRNMGSKLGKRLFPLDRVVAEVAWARDHGADAVHFVEANLNLLPYFRQLVARLAEVTGESGLKLYAELRGEHLSDEAVRSLVAAGLHAAEVGLQSANPEALLAVDRRTDLLKWAAGARRLYERGVEVFLDVILGLPGDDEAGVHGTLAWIDEQGLGPYDIFILQVLPGTSVREHAALWDLRYQDRPPYYVLHTDRLPYPALRALRWELKERGGFDPREVEGMPPLAGFESRHGRWSSEDGPPAACELPPIVDNLLIDCADPIDWQHAGYLLSRRVASRVTVHIRNFDAATVRDLAWPIAQANPTILWDLVIDGAVPEPAILRELRADWPHEVGYLDRVAVYARPTPEPPWEQVTPRFVLILPWGIAIDPLRYEGITTIMWRLDESPTSALLETIAAYGGDGVVIPTDLLASDSDLLITRVSDHGLLLWPDPLVPNLVTRNT